MAPRRGAASSAAAPRADLRAPPSPPLRAPSSPGPALSPTQVPLLEPSPCRPDADTSAGTGARHTLAHSHTERALVSLRALESYVSQLQADVTSMGPELLNPVLLQVSRSLFTIRHSSYP